MKNTSVIVNCVNPGFCYSELAREATPFQLQVLGVIRKVIARTGEKGGRQLVYAAVGESDAPERLHGGYINLHALNEPSDYVLGDSGRKRQDKLWVRLNCYYYEIRVVNLALMSECAG